MSTKQTTVVAAPKAAIQNNAEKTAVKRRKRSSASTNVFGTYIRRLGKARQVRDRWGVAKTVSLSGNLVQVLDGFAKSYLTQLALKSQEALDVMKVKKLTRPAFEYALTQVNAPQAVLDSVADALNNIPEVQKTASSASTTTKATKL